jgi:galactokinase
VIALAKPGAALLFDCFDYEHRSIAIDDPNIRVAVLGTGVKRQLVHSAYNARLQQTKAAAAALGVDRRVLGRLAYETFEARGRVIGDETVYRRARHVVGEAARVGEAVVALQSWDWTTLGRVLSRSHVSLRDDFEVSCAELDVLVDALSLQSGCYGARMTGAGFGGSVVALIDSLHVEAAMANAASLYANRFGHAPSGFVAHSVGGVRSRDG